MASRAVIVADTDGVITHWNEDAEVLFGHPATEAIGQRVDLIVPGHLREAHWAGFQRAMANPEIKDMAADMPILFADGEVRECAGRLLALSDGLGTAVGAMAVYTDAGQVGFNPFG